MPKRKALSKKLRFEVFKRDGFKCVYCGRSAPEVILHIDHVKPVAKGGKNTLVNLVCSCFDCNIGKGARELSDDSLISKQKKQADKIKARQEQLEMMVKWYDSLEKIQTTEMEVLVKKWHQYVKKQYRLSQEGQRDMKKHLKKYGFQEVLNAMATATEQYLKYNEKEEIEQKSVNLAFKKISGICRIRAFDGKDKEIYKKVYYIRGILKNRVSMSALGCKQCIGFIIESHKTNKIPLEKIQSIATRCNSYYDFQTEIDNLAEGINNG